MLVYVRGAGDIATGVAARLVRAGVSVVMADIAVPTCIRRTISFCEAIRLGEVQVEGIRARLAQTPAEALEITRAGDVAVVACDDRPGTLTPEWVPGVYDRRLVDYKNLSELCPIGPRDLVVVATAGHKSDIDVVIQAMRAKPACLGSRRKTAFVRARLEQEGFTQDQIDELHLPIGVAIEAEDPEEIAISIAAEMIHLRRTKLIPRKR